MRVVLRAARSTLRWLPSLLALLVVLSGCGSPALKVDLVGRVETPAGGPMSGVLVHAGTTLTTAATDGSFEIPGVTVPYTLSVASTAGDGWVHAFAGLTSATPVVVPMRFEPPLLDGDVTGNAWGGSPVPAGYRVSICVEGLDFVAWGCRIVDEGDTTYTLHVLWSGGLSANVRIHAIYMAVDADERPTGYTGVRHRDAIVSNGGTTNLDLSPVLLIGTAPLVPITIDAGSGTIGAVIVAARISDRLVQTLYMGGWPGGTVDVRMPPPGVADAYQVTARVLFPSGLVSLAWAVADSGDPIEIVVPPPPQLLEPANGAADVTTADAFRAAGGGSVARLFEWSPTGATAGPKVLLTTEATSVTLPNVGVVGMSYPAGGTYAWQVLRVDAPDYAAAAALRFDDFSLFAFGGRGQVVGGAIAASEQRDLTLAP